MLANAYSALLLKIERKKNVFFLNKMNDDLNPNILMFAYAYI